MTVKDHMLKALQQADGAFLSGAELAQALGVSRNAIWKAVKALIAEGYRIESVTGRGYRLTGADVLCAQTIENLTADYALQVMVHDCLPSTNRTAKALAEDGASQGTVVIAASQTDGRGRLGRSFCSPPDTGLYMSVILRPTMEATRALYITVAAAVAVCRALETVADVTPSIKWVNDIYCDDRKVCGILTEASMQPETGALSYAVLGIGINVRPPTGGFPKELQAIAGSVFSQDDAAVDRNTLCAAVLREFFELYRTMDEETFVVEYRQRSMLTNRAITVSTPCADYAATAVEVDDQCRLVIRDEKGIEHRLSSGDVRIRL